ERAFIRRSVATTLRLDEVEQVRPRHADGGVDLGRIALGVTDETAIDGKARGESSLALFRGVRGPARLGAGNTQTAVAADTRLTARRGAGGGDAAVALHRRTHDRVVVRLRLPLFVVRGDAGPHRDDHAGNVIEHPLDPLLDDPLGAQ